MQCRTKKRVRLAIDKKWDWREEEGRRRNWDRYKGIHSKGDREKKEFMVKGNPPSILEMNTNSPDIWLDLPAINCFLNYF